MIRKLKNVAHLLIAVAANSLYQFPAKNMKIIAITGTDGKTTTTSIIYHILKESGKKVSVITTLGAEIGGKVFETGFHTTTPSSFFLQQYIKKAKDAGSEYLVLEITSHGLDQNRDWGIPVHIGVLTNITHEHLDYHKTYENYVEAKFKLLKKARTAIVNKDDESFKLIDSRFKIQDSRFGTKKIITYGLTKEADVNPSNFSFETKLIGDFNKHNCLGAIAAALEIGISQEDIKQAIKTFSPPVGRQEVIHDEFFKVIVDFAHTPNSLEKILPELKKFTKKRLIHVFGAAGKRDASKRPLMGQASAKYADIIILTAEDPRSESIEEINGQIMEGIGKPFIMQQKSEKLHGKNVCILINDREEAIRYAVSIAQEGDVIVITGKGHEKSMNYGNGEVPWSDRDVAIEALSENKVARE